MFFQGITYRGISNDHLAGQPCLIFLAELVTVFPLLSNIYLRPIRARAICGAPCHFSSFPECSSAPYFFRRLQFCSSTQTPFLFPTQRDEVLSNCVQDTERELEGVNQQQQQGGNERIRRHCICECQGTHRRVSTHQTIVLQAVVYSQSWVLIMRELFSVSCFLNIFRLLRFLKFHLGVPLRALRVHTQSLPLVRLTQFLLSALMLRTGSR